MFRALTIAAALVAATAVVSVADDHKTPYPEGASVYIISPSDGDAVSSPVTIQFGLSGMGVAPAGTEDLENVGHHHLLLNRPPFGEGEDGEEEWEYGIIADDNHIHFGGGQTEVTLDLPAGEHTLQLVLGDHAHVPFGPDLTTDHITIVVE
ncbi:MAG: DUF4399 domain-containing protein [Pseudomonadota bacterium]